MQRASRARFLKGHRLRRRHAAGPDGLPLSRCARPADLALTFRGRGHHTPRHGPSAPASDDRRACRSRDHQRPGRADRGLLLPDTPTDCAASSESTSTRPSRRSKPPDRTPGRSWCGTPRSRSSTAGSRGLPRSPARRRGGWPRAPASCGWALIGDSEPGTVPEPPADTADQADRGGRAQAARPARQRLRAARPREREALYLKPLGHSHQEIPALTNASYTAVNRHIEEGRATLRKLARERDTQTGGRKEGAKTRLTAPSQSPMDIQPIT